MFILTMSHHKHRCTSIGDLIKDTLLKDSQMVEQTIEAQYSEGIKPTILLFLDSPAGDLTAVLHPLPNNVILQ